MLRIQRLALQAAALAAIWATALLRAPLSPRAHALLLWVRRRRRRRRPTAPPLGTSSPLPFHPQSPLLALVAFGVYLLLWLAVGVVTFRTVPEEAEALRRDIARARRGLAKLGVKA